MHGPDFGLDFFAVLGYPINIEAVLVSRLQKHEPRAILMSSYKNSSFDAIRKSFQLAKGLPFADILTENDIRKAFDDAECHFAENDTNIFNPAVALWAFLSQMLFSGAARSCDAAVLRIRQLLQSLGKTVCAFNSGGYCKARVKIDEAVPDSLIHSIADKAERGVKEHWKWNGREHVYLVDGAEITGPDTIDNQTEYPQPDSQAEGCGFPMMRIVVLTSLITAMVRSVAVGPYSGKETGESALFRNVMDTIPKGSVVVGDRYYCSYFAICQLIQRGVDVVTRLTTKRLEALGNRDSFERLKNGDLLVTWKRPQRPDWMTPEEHDTMPETLTLRLVEVRVAEKGFRVEHLWVVTTLLDTERDSSESLAELYRKRWNVELDLNAIKTMMGLDILRGKTPHMMRLELLIGLLAYNLVRLLLLNTASQMKVSPRGLSYTSGLSVLSSGFMSVAWMTSEMFDKFVSNQVSELSKHRAGHRAGRLEPRVLKRRMKAYPRMQEPRSMIREKLLTPKKSP